MDKFDLTYLDKDFLNSFNNKTFLFKNKGNNIFYGKILNDNFCYFIMKKVMNYELHEKNDNRYSANSMNNNAIPIAELDLNEFIQLFVDKFLVKVIHSLFPERMNQLFDGLHCYIVRYSKNTDTNLDLHVDDSLVTMNLCLNDEFTGSDLVFNGIRCPIHIDTTCLDNEEINIKHKKGFITLHDGKNRHYVNSIKSGNRYSLIIWCQNQNEKIEWFNSLDKHECANFCNYQN